MAFGKTYRSDRINDHSLKEFAKQMNFRPEKVAQVMNQISNAVSTNYSILLSEHEKKYGLSDIYFELQKIIQKNLEGIESVGGGW